MIENRKLGIFILSLFCLCFLNCLNFHSNNRQESTPIQTITTIRTLQSQYASKHQGKFAPNFDELVKTVQLDDNFGGEKPVVNGYVFEMKVIEPTGNQRAFYSIKANPQISEGIRATGTRYFYFDSTLGTIKYSEDGEADAQSSSI